MSQFLSSGDFAKRKMHQSAAVPEKTITFPKSHEIGHDRSTLTFVLLFVAFAMSFLLWKIMNGLLDLEIRSTFCCVNYISQLLIGW